MRTRVVAAVAVLGMSFAVPAHGAEGWREVALPFLWPRNGVEGIGASGPSDVWIAGYQGSIPIFSPPLSTIVWTDGNPVVRRWDGTAWREYPLPGFSGDGRVTRVAASASGTWVLGRGNGAQGIYLARFASGAFTRVAAPAGLSTATDLTAGPAGIWLSGVDSSSQVFLARWDGAAWQRTPVPAGFFGLTSVTGTGANEAFATGERVRPAPGQGTRYAALRWNGTSWSETAVPDQADGADGGLVSAAAAAPADVWAVGAFSTASGSKLRRWNGSTWQSAPQPAELPYPQRVVSDGAGRLWLAGQNEAGTTVLLRRTSTGWSVVPAPALRLTSITALPGADVLWAAGTTANDRTAVMTTP
ncbi:hypothetical protein [Actinocorallia longicatena]|uniref:Uncharacterized protein n=1 Tax=Actinocorallia longicatena TaxID=111803 RepID=A0ABP6Q8D1_9ACTN